MALSKYGRVFNKSNTIRKGLWENNQEYNLMTLKSFQNYFNDLLKIQGYVFLRDIYEALGFRVTKESVIAGWFYEKNNEYGDDLIDFNLKRNVDKTDPDIVIDFINVDENILNRFEEES